MIAPSILLRKLKVSACYRMLEKVGDQAYFDEPSCVKFCPFSIFWMSTCRRSWSAPTISGFKVFHYIVSFWCWEDNLVAEMATIWHASPYFLSIRRFNGAKLVDRELGWCPIWSDWFVLKHLPDLESTLLNHGRPFQLLLSGCHLASACHKYSLTYMYVFRAFQHIKHNPSSDATRTCPLCQSLSRLLMTAALSSCVQRPLSNRS